MDQCEEQNEATLSHNGYFRKKWISIKGKGGTFYCPGQFMMLMKLNGLFWLQRTSKKFEIVENELYFLLTK